MNRTELVDINDVTVSDKDVYKRQGVTSPYLNDWTMCLAACLPLLPESRRVCLNSRSAVSREQL